MSSRPSPRRRWFHILVYRDHKGEWRWRLRATNGRVIAASSEGYGRRHGAKRNLAAVAHALVSLARGGQGVT